MIDRVHRDPTARALSLLALLQAGGDWSGPELGARLGVTARTVRRDADRLRRLGYAVDTRPGPGGRYRLGAGTRIPPLLLEPDEITALVAGLRLVGASAPGDDAAARALAKLAQVLPERLRRRALATDLATEVLADGDSADDGVDARAIGLIADAVATDGRVRFAYRDQRGRRSARLVDPYRHVHRNGHWHLVGFDVDRDDWRLFRLDRVDAVETVPGHHPRRDPPDESLERWFATDFGRVPLTGR